MPELLTCYQIDNFIDTFALGHYARVLRAYDLRNDLSVAFKVLRTEHLTLDGEMKWEYRAFGNEVEILTKLAESPHVVQFYDCGYLSAQEEAPTGGEIESFGLDATAFTKALPSFAEKGWRPYLVMEDLPRNDNLYYAMKPNQQSARRRLPSEEGLALAIQFAKVLNLAHASHIVYLDHKLEHIYWDGNTLKIIDFNSSKQVSNGANLEQEVIKDIRSLCVGVLYSIFTGMSPQSTSLRPQPGNMQQVEERYQDVMALDFVMESTLSPSLQEVLQMGAQSQFRTIGDFTEKLHEIAALHGWDFPGLYTSATSRQARDYMRQGLRRIREGERQIREARDIFRDAMIQENITEDLEEELRRLVKSLNDMLNKRVIP